MADRSGHCDRDRIGSPGDPAILLIMGTSAQGIGWPDELVDVLVAGGRQVIRFDHRDTGRSSCADFASRPYTLADMAADAAAVLEGHRPERVLTVTAIRTGPLGHNAGPRGHAPWPGRRRGSLTWPPFPIW